MSIWFEESSTPIVATAVKRAFSLLSLEESELSEILEDFKSFFFLLNLLTLGIRFKLKIKNPVFGCSIAGLYAVFAEFALFPFSKVFRGKVNLFLFRGLRNHCNRSCRAPLGTYLRVLLSWSLFSFIRRHNIFK